MPSSSPLVRLLDIVEAIDLLRNELAGVSLAALELDRRKRWIVERGIEIISEASRRLPEQMKERHPLDAMCRAELASRPDEAGP